MLHITPWERRALQLLANGTTTNELASDLGIRDCDVEAHLTTLFARMGAANQSEAIVAAGRRGLLTGAAVRFG